MKKLYSTLLALLLTVAAFGADAKVNWGYALNSPTAEFGSKTSGKGAIYIPAEVARLYQGCTIGEVQVALTNATTSLNVFVTSDLNATASNTGTASSIKSGANTVALSSAYTIGTEGFYVGYSYSGSTVAMGCSDLSNPNACWADLGSGWKDYSSQGKALCIKAVISGDASTMPVEGALVSLTGVTVEKDKPVSITGSFVNLCPNVIRSFQLAYSVDGGEEQTLTVSKKVVLGSNTEREFTIDLDPFTEPGTHTVSVRLVQLGGNDDAYAGNNSATCTVDVRRLIPVRRNVLENNTGLDCGWCPYGIVAIRNMYAQYPNQFIGIEIFTAGDLYTSTYEPHCTDSTPIFTMNRETSQTVTTLESVASAMNTYKNSTPEMQVEVEGAIVNDNQVTATATTTFVTSKTNANYRIAFVITEDSIKGYSQDNYFYGGGHGEMGGFENLGPVAKIDQNHVARYIYEYNGFYGSVPYQITAYEPMTFTRTLDLPGTLQNTAYLHIIALLLDSNSGVIVNAAEANITGGKISGIADVEQSSAPDFTVEDGRLITDGYRGTVGIYNLRGQQVPNGQLTSGAYIVKAKGASGTFTKKILIK